MLDQLETMNAEDLMKYFGVSRRAIYSMVGDGRLPSPIRVGKQSRWFKSSIEKAVASMAENSEKNLACNRQRYRRAA